MTYTFEAPITHKFLKQVFWRTRIPRFLVSYICALALAALFYMFGTSVSSPLPVAFSYVLIFFVLVHIYQSFKVYVRIRKSKDEVMRITATDERFLYETDTVSGSVTWDTFKSSAEYKGFMLLCTDKRAGRTLVCVSTNGMPEDVKNFIDEKISAVGGILIDRM